MKKKEKTKISILISYVDGIQSHFDPVMGDFTTKNYTDFLVYATSLTDMYKRMKLEKGISKSQIIVKTLL
jgi:hypothetical protein